MKIQRNRALNVLKLCLVLALACICIIFSMTSCKHFCKHKEVEAIAAKEPTCTEDGHTSGTMCVTCGDYVQKPTVIPMLGHSETDWIIDKAVTCNTDGLKHTECDVCNQVVQEQVIPKTGNHVRGNWVTISYATCEEDGERREICTDCNTVLKTEVIPKDPDGKHNISWVTLKDATCAEEGSMQKVCTICKKVWDPTPIPKLAHNPQKNFTLYQVTTCSQKGIYHKYCKDCEQIIETKTIDPIPHYFLIDKEVEPTCTTPGYTIGRHCSVCGYVIDPQIEIPALGHSVPKVGEKGYENCLELILPTYNTPGRTEQLWCSVCDKVFKKAQEIPAVKDVLVFEYDSTTNTCIISGITDEARKYSELILVDIPETVTYEGKTYVVAGVKESAFENCTNLRAIVLPKTIVSIGTRAFYGCTMLQQYRYDSAMDKATWWATEYDNEFVIPENVTEFGTQIFDKASNIHTIRYKSNAEISIDNQLFNVPNIKKIIFDGAIVPAHICYNCPNIEEIVLTDNVKKIGESAFYNCTSLKYIVSNNVTEIGAKAFAYCESLVSVDLKNALTSIGNDAFNGCESLEKVYIESTDMWCKLKFGTHKSNPLYYADEIAFTDGTPVTDVVIPAGVTEIYAYHFAFNSLQSITISQGVTKIGVYAFEGCKNLRKVYVASSDQWCRMIFGNLNANPLYNSVLDEKNGIKPIELYFGTEKAENVVIPDGVTSIYAYLFACDSLKSVTIPASVTSIGENAFKFCTSIENVSVATVEQWCKMDFKTPMSNPLYLASNPSITFTQDTEHVETDANGKLIITVPNTITSIRSYTFSAVNISGIVISNATKTIYENAFNGCDGLESITLPFIGRDVTNASKNVFGYIFGYSETEDENGVDIVYNIPEGLKKIEITSGNIPDYAFQDCVNAETIIIPNTVKHIGAHAFEGCKNLKEIIIPNSLESIGEDAFKGCEALETVIVSTLDQWLKLEFGNAYSNPLCYADYLDIVDLRNENGDMVDIITVTEDMTKISPYLFSCLNLKEIHIHAEIGSIDANAFAGCDNLEKITLPYIGRDIKNESGNIFASVFGGKAPKSLTTITITAGTVVPESAFWGSSARSITLPNSITSIGANAFYNCASLEEIVIPDSLKAIGNNAFSGCTSLLKVKVKSIENWLSIDFKNNKSNPLFYADALMIQGVAIDTVIVPDTVSTIYPYAFSCNHIKKVVIPSSVTKISAGAFAGCSSLESLTIPFIGLSTTYNYYPFGAIFGTEEAEGCQAVVQSFTNTSDSTEYEKTYYIPEGLTEVIFTGASIPNGAFEGCSFIEKIVLDTNCTKIGDRAFAGCSGITDIHVNSALNYIGKDAFEGCTEGFNFHIASVYDWCNITLKSDTSNPILVGGKLVINQGLEEGKLVIPEGVTNIPAYAFMNTDITEVIIPSTVISIGEDAFKGCENLTVRVSSVAQWCSISFKNNEANPLYSDGTLIIDKLGNKLVIPDGITKIPEYAFIGLDVTEIVIPDSVVSIGKNAFLGCTGVESLTLPITAELGENVLNYLFGESVPTGLCKLTVLSGNISGGAFAGCDNLVTVVINKCGTIGVGAFKDCTSLESVTITECGSVGDGAFAGCTSLTTVYIPKSATSIGSEILAGCTSIENITVPFLGNRLNSSYTFDYLFNKNDLDAVHASVKRITVLSGNITEYAFANYTALISLELPQNAKTIGKFAFANCESLTDLTIPSSVTTIGKSILSGCKALETLTIPFVGDSVKSSADTNQFPLGYIFGDDQYEGATLTEQYYYAENISLHTLGKYYIPDSLKTVTVSGGNILSGAFYGCANIRNIKLPAGITAIEAEAFYGCSALEEIVIPSSVKVIKTNAFYGCTGLKAIAIGDGVEKIEEFAFSHCTSLERIDLGRALSVIEKSAFSECTSLTQVKYNGTEAQFELINIGGDNDSVVNANKTYK